MEDDFNDFSELSAGETSIGLRRCFAQVTAERDQLRSTVAGLRRALDKGVERLDLPYQAYSGDRAHCQICGGPQTNMGWLNHEPDCIAIEMKAALAASPDEHARRIKAEALRSTAAELEVLRDYIQDNVGPDDARDDIRRICWNRAKDLREEANQLEAPNGR